MPWIPRFRDQRQRAHRVERAVRVLEHRLHAPAQAEHIAVRHLRWCPAPRSAQSRWWPSPAGAPSSPRSTCPIRILRRAPACAPSGSGTARCRRRGTASLRNPPLRIEYSLTRSRTSTMAACSVSAVVVAAVPDSCTCAWMRVDAKLGAASTSRRGRVRMLRRLEDLPARARIRRSSPLLITMIRSARSAARPRSCVMNSTDLPLSRVSVAR